MVYLILIKKVRQQGNFHYYSVFKDNNEKDINYYICLDANQKKIFFHQELSKSAFAIYDLLADAFDMYDPLLLPQINGRVIMKALKTLSSNSFPPNISWES